MLVHLLAELFQHLFAIAAFLKHLKAAIYLVVKRDRAAKHHQIHTLNKHQNPDKDESVDNWFGSKAHIDYPSNFVGS